MPISEFQRAIFALLKGHRNPDSFVAGGTAINLAPGSARYSSDIDFFHDSDEAVTTAFQADLTAVSNAGFSIDIRIRQPSFCRAVISRDRKQLVLEWARDTAFRFFPVVNDELLGYRLHDCDLAINKCIAWANRTEIRDAIDMIEMDSRVISVAACAWAACGKDPGFTPNLILSMMERNSTFTPDMLASEALRRPIDPVTLKQHIRRMLDRAKSEVSMYPPPDLGCLYLDQKGSVIQHPRGEEATSYIKHYGSLKGSWPKIIT